MLKGLKRVKDKLFSESWDEAVQDTDELDIDPNSDIERKLGALIAMDINNATVSKSDATDELGWSIEDQWDDEYKLLKGGGLQWSTNIAYRSPKDRKIRPNSEDNFLHVSTEIQTANLTATPVESSTSGKKGLGKQSESVQHMLKFNDKQNNFQPMWKDMVHEFVAFGPIIAKVIFDPDWMGGAGPDRFVGEVKVEHVYKEYCLFDPAIRNLKRDMHKSMFQGFWSRQSVKYVANRWERYAKYISADINPDPDIDEGAEPNMVTLYEMYYRGFPEYVPQERVKELRQRAALQEEQGDTYKAKDLYDAANGEVEGVHLAYYCNDILLEYIPYVYDHGKYPAVFTTRYFDPKNQWGYGEIRNTKIPQILHNKADEIEIEAMVREGLGGGYYNEGAISDPQIRNILNDGSKGGMWFKVNNINQIRERTGVKVPPNITNYKEHKQRMCETMSNNTAISQGQMPKANMPFKAIAELGSRSDIRTQQSADILKDFRIEIDKLRIELFAQFYTEERYYRYCGTSKEVYEGTFRNDEIFDVWAREVTIEPMLDMNGQPIADELGQAMMQENTKHEWFIPQFDIDVNIISKKPDDRNYYTSLALDLFARQILTIEDLYYTLDEGKLPMTEDILEHVRSQNIVMGMLGQIQQLPPEVQQQAQQLMQQQLQMLVQQFAQQNMMAGGM